MWIFLKYVKARIDCARGRHKWDSFSTNLNLHDFLYECVVCQKIKTEPNPGYRETLKSFVATYFNKEK